MVSIPPWRRPPSLSLPPPPPSPPPAWTLTGDRGESYHSRRREPGPNYQADSQSPPYEDRYDDWGQCSNAGYDDHHPDARGARYDEKRSPGLENHRSNACRHDEKPHYERDRQQYEDQYNEGLDRRFEDSFANERGSRGYGGSSQPPVRSVKERFGEDVPPLQVETPGSQTNGDREVDKSLISQDGRGQRSGSSSSFGLVDGNVSAVSPVVKREGSTSLIDFSVEPEPPAPNEQSNSFGLAAVVQLSADALNSTGWATFGPPAPAPYVETMAQAPKGALMQGISGGFSNPSNVVNGNPQWTYASVRPAVHSSASSWSSLVGPSVTVLSSQPSNAFSATTSDTYALPVPQMSIPHNWQSVNTSGATPLTQAQPCGKLEIPEDFCGVSLSSELKDWVELEMASANEGEKISNLGSSVFEALLREFGSRLQEVPNMETEDFDVSSRITGILAREFEISQPHYQLSDENERENCMGSKINALVEDLQGRHLEVLEVLMLDFEKDALMIERTKLEILDFSDSTCVSEERQVVEKQKPLITVSLQNVPVPRSSVICCIDDDSAACYMCLPIFSSPTTEIQRLQNGMKHAISAYNKSAKLGLQNGPYIVANGITRCSYEKWILNIESSWRVAYFYNEEEGRGSVFLYGDPSTLHENVVFWFEDNIGDQARQNLGCRLCKIAYGLGSSTQTLLNGSQKQPDASFTSQSANPTCLPRVTLEVAFKNEDLSELVREVKDWHDSGVLLSLGIKIEAEGRSFYWVQQEPHDIEPKVINFSPDFCDESNQLQYRISFPFSYVTIDFDISRDFPVSMDLFELQKFIVDCQVFEAKRNHQVLYVDESGKYKVGKDEPCPLCKEGFGEKFMIHCEKCKFWYHVSCVDLDECNIPPSWRCNNCY